MIVLSINPTGHGLDILGDFPNIYSICFLALYLLLDHSGLFIPFLAGQGGPAVLPKKKSFLLGPKLSLRSRDCLAENDKEPHLFPMFVCLVYMTLSALVSPPVFSTRERQNEVPSFLSPRVL